MSTPQELLGQLHNVDIPALFSPDFPAINALPAAILRRAFNGEY
jgi:hypothetical protein